MTHLRLLAPTLSLAVVLVGCAGTAPVVDLEPGAALPDEVPLAWYTDAFGPYDPSVVGPVEEGPGGHPLFLVDGVQQDLADDDAVALMQESTEFLAARDVDPSERIRDVIVYKHRCDTAQFGPAGQYGAIMMFRADYEGPMPEPAHSYDNGVCGAES